LNVGKLGDNLNTAPKCCYDMKITVTGSSIL